MKWTVHLFLATGCLASTAFGQRTLEEIKTHQDQVQGKKYRLLKRSQRSEMIRQDADLKKMDAQLRKIFPKGSSVDSLYDLSAPIAEKLLAQHPELASAEPAEMWEILKTALPPLLQSMSEKDKQALEKTLAPVGKSLEKNKQR